MAKPIKATPTLRGEEADTFLRKMIKEEKRQITKKDKKLAKEISRNMKKLRGLPDISKYKSKKREVLYNIFMLFLFVVLLFSIYFLIVQLNTYYVYVHNVDTAFNALKDPSKLNISYDMYNYNSNTQEFSAKPCLAFYIESMQGITKMPYYLFFTGFLIGAVLIFIINRLFEKRR